MDIRYNYIIILAGLLTLLSCEHPVVTEVYEYNEIKENDFNLGEEFQLNYGERVHNYEENIELQFADLLDESRCPEDVHCVWAGNAKIELEFIVGKNSHALQLNTHSNHSTKQRIGIYTVELVELSPYPASINTPIPINEYTATLVVELSE